jgi:hypothetical protein
MRQSYGCKRPGPGFGYQEGGKKKIFNKINNNLVSDASRMETDGKGDIKPVAPDDNLTNKLRNRRVKFIKQ